jgi:hypothetical protein
MRFEGQEQHVGVAEFAEVVARVDARCEAAKVALNADSVATNRRKMWAACHDSYRKPGTSERGGEKSADRTRTDDRNARHVVEETLGDGQIRTAEWGFCRALPYHLATSPPTRWSG